MAVLPPGAVVLPDTDAVARAAAERLVARAASAERFAVALSGGSTPKRLYEFLAGPEFRARVPWERIHWFFGDERVGFSPEAGSNRRMVEAAFGAPSPAPPGHFHPVPTGPDPQDAAASYAAQLRAHHGSDRLDPARPLFDLVLLGLGEDGHTASLFPGKPEVGVTDRWAVGVPAAGLAPFVPRVSLTLPALASAREVLFLVTGAGKRAPLARLASGEDLPAGRVRADGALVWLLDAAAAG